MDSIPLCVCVDEFRQPRIISNHIPVHTQKSASNVKKSLPVSHVRCSKHSLAGKSVAMFHIHMHTYAMNNVIRKLSVIYMGTHSSTLSLARMHIHTEFSIPEQCNRDDVDTATEKPDSQNRMALTHSYIFTFALPHWGSAQSRHQPHIVDENVDVAPDATSGATWRWRTPHRVFVVRASLERGNGNTKNVR